MREILADSLVNANQPLIVRANLPAGRNGVNDEAEISIVQMPLDQFDVAVI